MTSIACLRALLEDQKGKEIDLLKQLIALKRECQESKDSWESSQNELSRSRERERSTTHERDSLKQANQECQRQLSWHQEQLLITKDYLKSLTLSKTAVDDELALLRTQFNVFQADNQSKSDAMKELMSGNLELQNKLERAVSERQSMKMKNNEFQLMIESQTKEMEAKQRLVDEMMNDREDEIRKLNQTVSEYQHKLSIVENDLQLLHGREASLKGALNDAEEESSRLTATISDLTDALQSARSQHAAKEKECSDFQSSSLSLKDINELMAMEIKELQTKLKAVEDRLISQQHSYGSLHQSTEWLKSTLHQQVQSLASQLEMKSKEERELQASLDALNVSYLKTKKELENVTFAAIQEKQDAAAALEGTCQRHETQMSNLKESLRISQTSLSNKEVEVMESHGAREMLQRQLSSSQADNEKQKGQAAAAREELTAMQQKHLQLQQAVDWQSQTYQHQIQGLNRQLQFLTGDLDSHKAAVQQSHVKYNEQLEEVRGLREQLDEAHRQAAEQTADLAREEKRRVAKLDELEDLISTKDRELHAKDDRIQVLVRTQQELELQLSTAESSRVQATAQSASLTADLESLRYQCQQLQQAGQWQQQALQQQYQQLQQQQLALAQKLEAATKEVLLSKQAKEAAETELRLLDQTASTTQSSLELARQSVAQQEAQLLREADGRKQLQAQLDSARDEAARLSAEGEIAILAAATERVILEKRLTETLACLQAAEQRCEKLESQVQEQERAAAVQVATVSALQGEVKTREGLVDSLTRDLGAIKQEYFFMQQGMQRQQYATQQRLHTQQLQIESLAAQLAASALEVATGRARLSDLGRAAEGHKEQLSEVRQTAEFLRLQNASLQEQRQELQSSLSKALLSGLGTPARSCSVAEIAVENVDGLSGLLQVSMMNSLPLPSVAPSAQAAVYSHSQSHSQSHSRAVENAYNGAARSIQFSNCSDSTLKSKFGNDRSDDDFLSRGDDEGKHKSFSALPVLPLSPPVSLLPPVSLFASLTPTESLEKNRCTILEPVSASTGSRFEDYGVKIHSMNNGDGVNIHSMNNGDGVNIHSMNNGDGVNIHSMINGDENVEVQRANIQRVNTVDEEMEEEKKDEEVYEEEEGRDELVQEEKERSGNMLQEEDWEENDWPSQHHERSALAHQDSAGTQASDILAGAYSQRRPDSRAAPRDGNMTSIVAVLRHDSDLPSIQNVGGAGSVRQQIDNLAAPVLGMDGDSTEMGKEEQKAEELDQDFDKLEEMHSPSNSLRGMDLSNEWGGGSMSNEWGGGSMSNEWDGHNIQQQPLAAQTSNAGSKGTLTDMPMMLATALQSMWGQASEQGSGLTDTPMMLATALQPMRGQASEQGSGLTDTPKMLATALQPMWGQASEQDSGLTDTPMMLATALQPMWGQGSEQGSGLTHTPMMLATALQPMRGQGSEQGGGPAGWAQGSEQGGGPAGWGTSEQGSGPADWGQDSEQGSGPAGWGTSEQGSGPAGWAQGSEQGGGPAGWGQGSGQSSGPAGWGQGSEQGGGPAGSGWGTSEHGSGPAGWAQGSEQGGGPAGFGWGMSEQGGGPAGWGQDSEQGGGPAGWGQGSGQSSGAAGWGANENGSGHVDLRNEESDEGEEEEEDEDD